MVRALDKADAMLTLSSALYRKPFTIYHFFENGLLCVLPALGSRVCPFGVM